MIYKKDSTESKSNKTEKDWITLTDNIAFTAYIALFLVMLVINNNVSVESNIIKALKDNFDINYRSSGEKLTELNRKSKIESIAQTLHAHKGIIGEKLVPVAEPRFTARRAKVTNQETLFNDEKYSSTLKVKEISAFAYFDSENESNESFNNIDFEFTASFLGNGGYVKRVNTYEETDLASFKENILALVDSQTVTVTFDTVLFDFESKYLIPMRITIAKLHSNTTIKSVDISPIDIKYHEASSTGEEVFKYIHASFLSLYFLFYLFLFGRSLKASYSKSRAKKNGSLFAVWEAFYDFITNIDYLLNLAQFSVAIAAMILNFMFVSQLRALDLSELDKLFFNQTFIAVSAQNDIYTISQLRMTFMDLSALNSMLLFLRILKFASKIVSRTQIFNMTINKSMQDLLGFMVFKLLLLFAMTTMTFFYFGYAVEAFSDFYMCLNINFQFLVGSLDSDIIEQMKEYNWFFTLLYLVILMVVMKFLVMKLILAILLYFYREAVEIFEASVQIKESDYNEKDKLKKGLLFNHDTVVKYFSHNVVKVLDTVMCVKKKNRVNLEQKQVELPSKVVEGVTIPTDPNEEDTTVAPVDFTSYDKQFNENYEVEERNLYFESTFDESKVKEFFEKRYTRIYLYMYFYLGFVVITGFSLLIVTETRWKYKILKRFNTNVDAQAQKIISNEVDSFEQARLLLSITVPNLFKREEDGFYQADYDKVVKDKVIYTSRQSKLASDFNSSEEYEIRENIDVSPWSTFDFEKEDISMSFSADSKAYFSRRESYGNHGGLVMVAEIKDVVNFDPLTESTLKDMINGKSTSATIEIVTHNTLMGYYCVYTVVVVGYEGGLVRYYTEIDYIPELDFSHVYNILKIVLFLVQKLFFIVFTYTSVTQVYSKYVAYKKWFSERIMTLTNKTIQIRREVVSEPLRMIYSLVDIDTINNLILIVLNMALIVLTIEHLTYIYSLDREEELYLTRNKLYRISRLSNLETMMVGSIFVCMSLKSFRVFKLNRYFLLLNKAQIMSIKDNSTFVFVLMLTQPAFVLFGLIAMGRFSDSFRTVFDSVKSCFDLMFGTIDFDEFHGAAGKMGVLFFYSYVFFINFFLINMFAAIIDFSYYKVLGTIATIDEKFNIWKVAFPWCHRKREQFTNVGFFLNSYEFNSHHPIPKQFVTVSPNLTDDDEFIETSLAELKRISAELEDSTAKNKTIEGYIHKNKTNEQIDYLKENKTNYLYFASIYKALLLYRMSEYSHNLSKDTRRRINKRLGKGASDQEFELRQKADKAEAEAGQLETVLLELEERVNILAERVDVLRNIDMEE